ncbi:hypothetical protein Tco_0802662 [Tanacetum coccineum]|uniref:Reverse transcriptase Ty1/copia-type domain-containing protein n=1 Tax=Tanacetum coccineum TaxID=301880 RepID=A0ABQ4ZZG2_9ASTR
MSSMGELTFFLGLQVKQQPDGIFISQDKYVADILKKFDFWSIRTATTPIESNKPLVKDEDGEDVDVHVYRSMIGSLMYLTTSRYITATVVGNPVSISEASIRSDLQFNDAAGIDVLPNQAIFDTIQLMEGKKNSRNVTPLFPSILAQPTEDEGEVSERPSETQPTPSPTHPKGSGGNHGGQSSSDRSLSGNEDDLTLQKCLHEEKIGKEEVFEDKVNAEGVSFDDLDDAMDYMATEDAHDKGIVKDSEETRVSTEDQVSTDKPKVGTDKPKVSTNKPNKGTTEPNKGTAEPKDGNSDESTTPTTVFRDDETIAQFLVSMSQNKAKQKGVEIKDAEDSNRPRPTSTRSLLTLKPLPKIDPKDKGKKVLEEEAKLDAKSKGVNEAERKFVQLANDEEIARKARIESDSILAARLQDEEREKFTIKERAKFLHDTIDAQRKFLAQQRAAEIRSRPPTRTQLRNQMMMYLKHVGGKKHSDLKNKNFEEIQVLYEKVKSYDENFVAIGSTEDERIIRELNKKAAGTKKADNIKEESKEEAVTRKRKLGTRKKMKSRKRRFRQNTSKDDSEKENDELRLCLTIAPDEDKEVDYEVLDKKYPIIEWKTEYLGTKTQFDKAKHLEEINLNVVIRSNGQKRYFSTLMRVLSIFDRDDLNVVYQLVMDRYQDELPEGFDRDWNVVSWKLHGSSGVHSLMTEAGLVIHMLVEKKYPLRKKVLLQMLELKLESEEDSTMTLELIRFVKKLVAKLEPKDSNGDREDL